MIKISKRLEAISSLIPINSNIIDIGCDHALLDIYLIQNKKVSWAIATDVNSNALNNAKANIQKYHLENTIETRLGNGIDPLNENDNIDTVIISGMGANTIIDILKSNISKLKNINTLIIGSNTKISLLRKELTKLNYYIKDEIIIEDNKKVYIIIKFIKGKRKYNKKELYFGPILLKKKDELFRRHYCNELLKLKNNLSKLPENNIIDKYKIKKEIRLYRGII